MTGHNTKLNPYEKYAVTIWPIVVTELPPLDNESQWCFYVNFDSLQRCCLNESHLDIFVLQCNLSHVTVFKYKLKVKLLNFMGNVTDLIQIAKIYHNDNFHVTSDWLRPILNLSRNYPPPSHPSHNFSDIKIRTLILIHFENHFHFQCDMYWKQYCPYSNL